MKEIVMRSPSHSKSRTTLPRRDPRAPHLPRAEALEHRVLLSASDLDLSFDADGKLVIPYHGSESAQALLVQPGDGKIVVVGSRAFDPNFGNTIGGVPNPRTEVDTFLARFNRDGSVDPTFGSFGFAQHDLGSMAFFTPFHDVTEPQSFDAAQSAVLQPDGKILVAGYVGNFTHRMVARFNPDGSLDASFGAGGLVHTFGGGPASSVDYFDGNTPADPADDGIVVAGGDRHNFVVARYNLDGSPDTTFSPSGDVTVQFAVPSPVNPFLPDVPIDAAAVGVVALPDGRIVAAGHAWASGGSSPYAFAVVRLLADGNLDTTFDGDGRVLTPHGRVASAADMVLQPDGKVVVAGTTSVNEGSAVLMARYLPDGQLDPAFGGAGSPPGLAVTSFGGGSVGDAALQHDGKIVLAARIQGFVLVRFNADGSPDNLFGAGGLVRTDFPAGSWTQVPGALIINHTAATGTTATGVAILPDGRILAAGSGLVTHIHPDIITGTDFPLETLPDFLLARYAGDPREALNSPPTASVGGPYTIAEGDPLTLDASTSTDSDDDPLTYSWDLNGDGTFGDANGATPTLTWARLVALGIDDGPSARSARVQVSDSANPAVTSAAAPLAVADAPPTVALGGDAAAVEGSPFTLTLGDLIDPGDDTVTRFNINWGDGAVGTYAAAGNLPGAVTHTYPDGPATHTLTVELVDEDGVHPVGTRTVQVSDVRPLISIGGNAPVEGEPWVLDLGAVIDPGADTATQVNIDWGDLTGDVHAARPNVPIGLVSHTYADGPATHHVTVEVVDEEATHFMDSWFAVVSNQAPVASVTGPAVGVRGQELTFSLRTTDAAADVATGFTYHIDWDGDGTVDETPAVEPNSSAVGIVHVYPGAGLYSVRVTATDKDGGVSAVATTAIEVRNVALLRDWIAPGSPLALFVGGGPGNDVVRLSAGTNAGDVTVSLDGVNQGTFHPTGRIVVSAGAGDDLVIVGPDVRLPAWLEGGRGNDALFGGNGPNVIQGGDGTDVLTSRDGRDLLIGGTGSDLLYGGNNSDLLIAGGTAFDRNDFALATLQAEWLSARSYARRLDNLRGIANPDFAARLNGGLFLQVDFPGASVFDDGSIDLLAGGLGTDACFANLDAGVLDLVPPDIGEQRIDID
jgi:uncharacterized delta-60 repeat protein